MNAEFYDILSKDAEQRHKVTLIDVAEPTPHGTVSTPVWCTLYGTWISKDWNYVTYQKFNLKSAEFHYSWFSLTSIQD